MISVVRCSGAVREQQTFVASVVGVAHGRVHTDVRRNTREHDVLDAVAMKQQIQVCRVKGAFPGLVDDRFTRERRELRDELPTRFPANENLSTRSRIADFSTAASSMDWMFPR